MTVLVTGGAGFIGAYVVRDLLSRGESVVLYDSLLSGNTLDIVLPARDEGLVLVQGQVADGWRLLRTCQRHGVDRIVHLAAPLTAEVTLNPPLGIQDICGAMASVLEVARSEGIRRVVWASSVAVFGPSADYPPGPVANDAFHRPTTVYGSCKSLCEQLARTYRDEVGVDSIGLRLTVVYGAGRLRGYMSFPSQLIRDCAAGDPITIAFPSQEMSWQYVEDVAGSILASLDAAHGRASIAYNTYGDVRTFADAASVLARLAPDVEIHYGDGSESSALEGVATAYDDSAFRSEVGYEPRFPMDRGIEETFAAYQRLGGSERPSERLIGTATMRETEANR